MARVTKKKTTDLLVLIILPILATVITFVFETHKIVSIFLYFCLPIIYLIWRNPTVLKKSFAFAFLFSIVLSVFIDVLAVYDGGWYIPDSIISYRLFGAGTLEVYLFILFWVLFSVLFYEHFFDRHKPRDWFTKKLRKLLYLFAFLVGGVVILYVINPSLLVIPYFYAWASIIFVVFPLIWFLIYFPKFLGRFVVLGIYFFFVLLLFEIAALHVGQWIFPGEHFIGWVELLGYRFPMEEFVFWAMLSTPSLLGYYEFFADDRKL